MVLRRAALVTASLAVAIGSSVPAAHADAAQDQQYLDMVHSNGVGGQDATLLTYAQRMCALRPGELVDLGLVGELMGQIGWLNPGAMYVVQTSASRVYCPNRIIQPPYQPPVIINNGY